MLLREACSCFGGGVREREDPQVGSGGRPVPMFTSRYRLCSSPSTKDRIGAGASAPLLRFGDSAAACTVTVQQRSRRECERFGPEQEGMNEAFAQGSAAPPSEAGSRRRATTVLVITEADTLFDSFKRKWHEPVALVRRCRSVGESLSEARLHRPSVVLIGCSGKLLLSLQLCRSLREMRELGPSTVIVIWETGIDEAGRLACYQAGCDDVLGEAEFTDEAMFRMLAATRRGTIVGAPDSTLRYGGLELDVEGYRVWFAGRLVRLSAAQTRLLQLFMEHPGRVFSRAELAATLWADKVVDVEAVKTAVVRLRQLLLKTGGASPIRNVKGEGYSLDLEIEGSERPHAAAKL